MRWADVSLLMGIACIDAHRSVWPDAIVVHFVSATAGDLFTEATLPAGTLVSAWAAIGAARPATAIVVAAITSMCNFKNFASLSP